MHSEPIGRPYSDEARPVGEPTILRLGMISTMAALLCACSLTPRDSFTAEDLNASETSGLTGVKIWADAPPGQIARLLDASRLRPKSHCDVNFLALSGGGADGAFGAGLLKGWSKAGTRPTFDVVSGVSTGALIAPFAFLGKAYDGSLEQLFAGELPEKLSKSQNPLKSLLGRVDIQRSAIAAPARYIMALKLTSVLS